MPAIVLLVALLAAGHAKASEACDRTLDVAFAVDGSTTVCGGTEPCDKWYAILQLCKDIISSLTIGPNNTRVAFVTVFDSMQVEWGFKKYSDKASLLTAVDNVKYQGGELIDMLSFAKAITDIFNPSKGDRIPVQNVGILISDGARNFDDVVYAAESFVVQVVRDVVMFVICATPGCSENCAKGVASPPKKANETYFLIDDYLDIRQVTDRLVKKVCAAKTTVQSVVGHSYE